MVQTSTCRSFHEAMQCFSFVVYAELSGQSNVKISHVKFRNLRDVA